MWKSQRSKLVIAAFLLLSGAAHAQFSEQMNIYSFRGKNREDSIAAAVTRVTQILKTQAVFEKTFLNRELVFMPLSTKYKHLFKADKPYLWQQDYRALLLNDKALNSAYLVLDKKLKKAIIKQNVRTIARNKELVKLIGEKPETQDDLNDLSYRKDYEIIFCPRAIFLNVDQVDPRENTVSDSLTAFIKQRLLGTPGNIDGYINSSNYLPFNSKNFKIPDFIDLLVRENLALWKRIVTDQQFSKLIQDVQVSNELIPGNTKLWLLTNVSKRKIFLSPYLTRAAFNISFYKIPHLKRATMVRQNGGDLEAYFRGKSSSSVRKIDQFYFEHFVDDFSKNLFFVLGHELAHVYLSQQKGIKNLESACDNYAAYYYIKHFGKLDAGIFDTMLIKSIQSHELDFWGKNINKAALLARYQNLQNIQKSGKMSDADMVIQIP